MEHGAYTESPHPHRDADADRDAARHGWHRSNIYGDVNAVRRSLGQPTRFSFLVADSFQLEDIARDAAAITGAPRAHFNSHEIEIEIACTLVYCDGFGVAGQRLDSHDRDPSVGNMDGES
jgi:hypothetical protein